MDSSIMTQKMCVYCATNTVNGKKYIGKTVNELRFRVRAHFYDAMRPGGKSDLPFHRAIRKYGREAFTWSILYVGDSNNDIIAAEIRLIAENKTASPHGYNATYGGEGTSTLTHESMEKRKESLRRSFATTDHANKISASLKGITRSKETREKMSVAAKGKIISQEQRQKASVATKKAFDNEEYKSAHAQRIREAWADPVKREKMLAGRKSRQSG